MEKTVDGRRLFAPVSFTLAPGQIIHVQGGNGVGKTTLLHCLAGFISFKGDITYADQPIDGDFFNRQSYCGPHLHLPLCERVNALNIGDDYGLFPLGELAQCKIRQLSAGQQQRLKLALALHHHDVIWVLDEPFVFLDDQHAQALSKAMATYLEAGGRIIITSHQREYIPQTAEILTMCPLQQSVDHPWSMVDA